MMLSNWKISQLDDGLWIGEYGSRRTPKMSTEGGIRAYIRTLIHRENKQSKNLDKIYPA